MANTLTPIHTIKKPAWKDERWDIPTNENWDKMDGLLPPKGGLTGQVLAKKSDADNDLEFIDGGGGGGGGFAWETTALDTVAAEANKGYFVDTTASGSNVGLPVNPAVGDTIGVGDWKGTCSVHSVVILPDTGDLIMGSAEPLVIDNDDRVLTLVYTNATEGWKIVSDITPRLVPNDILTGNILGLKYSYSTASQIGVGKGTCYDSLNATKIVKNGDTTVDLIEANIASWIIDGSAVLINQVYNIFVIEGGGILFDTDVDGANITEKKRWLGFVRSNSSGNLCVFSMSGCTVQFGLPAENVLAVMSTTGVIIDHSEFIPITRIDNILYGINNYHNVTLLMSTDGGVTFPSSLGGGDNGVDRFNSFLKNGGHWVAFNAEAFFKCDQLNCNMLIHSVQLKR